MKLVYVLVLYMFDRFCSCVLGRLRESKRFVLGFERFD